MQLQRYPLFLDGEGDPSGPGTASVVKAPAPIERRNDSQPGLRGDADSGAIATTMRDLRAAVARGEVAFAGQEGPVTGVVQTPAAETPVEPDPAAPDTDEAAIQAAAQADAGEVEEVEETEEALEADDPLLNIELPPRRAGQEAIAIRVEDQETAEALRHMRNLAGRTQAAEAVVSQARQAQVELEAFEELLALDPVGVVLARLPAPKQVEMARHILAALPDAELAQVQEDLERWQQTPETRRGDAAVFENTRIKTAGRVQEGMTIKEQNRQIVDSITTNVNLLTELVDPEIAQQFRDDCLGDMASFARTNRLTGPVAPERFPDLLARRLRLYGLDPKAARAALEPDAPPSHPSARPRPKGPAAEALAASPAAQRAQGNGKQFFAASRVRQAAAAGTPPAGAAISVGQGLRPPKGGGVQGTIDWLRKQAGIPAKARAAR